MGLGISSSFLRLFQWYFDRDLMWLKLNQNLYAAASLLLKNELEIDYLGTYNSTGQDHSEIPT